MNNKSKPYKTIEYTQMIVSEPAVAYNTAVTKNSFSNEWNPNIPFQGTQEEWWEHFHQIEEGNFMTWEEHQEKFYTWKKKLLESRMQQATYS